MTNDKIIEKMQKEILQLQEQLNYKNKTSLLKQARTYLSKTNIFIITILTLLSYSLIVYARTPLTPFTPNKVISSSEVNGNFTELEDRIDSLNNRFILLQDVAPAKKNEKILPSNNYLGLSGSNSTEQNTPLLPFAIDILSIKFTVASVTSPPEIITTLRINGGDTGQTRTEDSTGTYELILSTTTINAGEYFNINFNCSNGTNITSIIMTYRVSL